MSEAIRVDIWSDIACPWCYVGKRRFEAALRAFPERDRVQIVWRSFELDPSAPRVLPSQPTYTERLAKKYGIPPAQGAAMISRMTETAAREGVTMDFSRIRAGSTFDAHRLLHFALGKGVQDALKERLLRAYFTEGKSVGEHDVLLCLAEEVGLDVDEAQGVLAGDAHGSDVRDDQARAHTLGVHGVPFFLVGGRYGVSGAQSPEALLSVLQRCQGDGASTRQDEGEICGPDGCAPGTT